MPKPHPGLPGRSSVRYQVQNLSGMHSPISNSILSLYYLLREIKSGPNFGKDDGLTAEW